MEGSFPDRQDYTRAAALRKKPVLTLEQEPLALLSFTLLFAPPSVRPTVLKIKTKRPNKNHGFQQKLRYPKLGQGGYLNDPTATENAEHRAITFGRHRPLPSLLILLLAKFTLGASQM